MLGFDGATLSGAANNGDDATNKMKDNWKILFTVILHHLWFSIIVVALGACS
jgi:hypothetical protein